MWREQIGDVLSNLSELIATLSSRVLQHKAPRHRGGGGGSVYVTIPRDLVSPSTVDTQDVWTPIIMGNGESNRLRGRKKMNQFHVLLPFSFRLERASRKKSILIADAISRRYSQPGKKKWNVLDEKEKKYSKCLQNATKKKKKTNEYLNSFVSYRKWYGWRKTIAGNENFFLGARMPFTWLVRCGPLLARPRKARWTNGIK